MTYDQKAFLADTIRVIRDPLLLPQAHAHLYEKLQQILKPIVADVLEQLLAEHSAGPTRAAPARNAAPAFGARYPDASANRTRRESLSRREYQVLERIAAGASNKAIARDLNLSPHTVKRHVANILAKLGVASRTQAGAWLRAHH